MGWVNQVASWVKFISIFSHDFYIYIYIYKIAN